MAKNNLEKDIKLLIQGVNMPDVHLIESGEFPVGWVDTYTRILKENRFYWQNVEALPKSLSYYFYRVGFNIPLAYKEWQRTSQQSNEKTEKEIHKINLCTQIFITGNPGDIWPN